MPLRWAKVSPVLFPVALKLGFCHFFELCPLSLYCSLYLFTFQVGFVCVFLRSHTRVWWGWILISTLCLVGIYLYFIKCAYSVI